MATMVKRRPEKQILERACRVYSSDADAGRALGVSAVTFSRWCKQLGLLTPYQRRLEKCGIDNGTTVNGA